MAGHAQILRIVVASPGDVKGEREIASAVAEELNKSLSADRGLRLDIVSWETDAHPGFHPDGPQGLIDTILRIDDNHFRDSAGYTIVMRWQRRLRNYSSGDQTLFLVTHLRRGSCFLPA
jgi:hypothetical protein